MSTTELILWILVNFSIANAFIHSKVGIWASTIFLFPEAFIREFFSDNPDYVLPVDLQWTPQLFRCMMCLSFWTAGFLTLCWGSPTGFFLWDMFLGSATAWIIYLFIMERQDKT